MGSFVPYFVAGVKPEPDYVLTAFDRARLLLALRRRGWNPEIAETRTLDNLMRAHTALRREGKGMLISGELGNGKTTLMNAYIPLLRNGYVYYDMNVLRDVTMLYNALGDESSLDLRFYNVVIDDIGVERTRSDYGVYSEVIGMLLRYLGSFRRPVARLIATTNYDEDWLVARYGGPEVSRLAKLCVPMPYFGPDRREWTDLSKVDVGKPTGITEEPVPFVDDDFGALMTPELEKRVKEINNKMKGE